MTQSSDNPEQTTEHPDKLPASWNPPCDVPVGPVEIQKLLPHRYPFILIDKIIEVSPGRAVGIKNVTVNEPYFQGHFPGRPVMPGVMQLEAMAQAAVILSKFTQESEGKILVFAGMDKVRFRRLVQPGDVLRIEITEVFRKKKLGRVNAVATVDGEVVSEAEITYGYIPA
jgi:3-hydroxyacyl-[acyl-carrier-protein] dehydratase